MGGSALNEKGFFSFAGEKAGGGVWYWRREIDETFFIELNR